MSQNQHRSPRFPEERGRFLEHYLRAFAPVLPWFKAPQLTYSDLRAEDFCLKYHDTIERVLKPRVSADQSLEWRRRLIRHLSYAILWSGVQCHVSGERASYVEKITATELCNVAREGTLYIGSPHHILYNDYRATPLSGNPVGKFITIDAKDRELSRRLVTSGSVHALIQQSAEFIEPSKDCRVLEYAREVRSSLREMLKGHLSVSKQVREECFSLLIDAWTTHTKQTHLEDRSKQVTKKYGLDGQIEEDPAIVLQKMHPSQIQTREQEEEWRPVYEQSLMYLCNEQFSVKLDELITEWGKVMLRLGIAACDRQSLNMALLARELQDPESEIADILSRL